MDSTRASLVILFFAVFISSCHVGSAAQPRDAFQSLSFEGAIAEPLIEASATASLTGRLRIGTLAPAEAEKHPINVALVVDTSGSMVGSPIEDAKAAALAMVGGLADGDRLALVAFHSTAEVLFPSTELDDDARKDVLERIGEMRAQGTTDMQGGLRAGLDEVLAHTSPGGIDRVVLLGDGFPNEEGSLKAIASEAGNRGVSVTSLGLGLDYDESLMGALAQLSGGRFHYVDDSAKIGAFFRQEVLRLQGVYARSAAVVITPGPGVVIEDVVGQRVTQIGSKLRVELGDMSRDDARDLFVRLTATPHREGAGVELFDALLTWTDPAGGEVRERRVFVGAQTTTDVVKRAEARDSRLLEEAALAGAAAAVVDALRLAREGRSDEARALLLRVATELDAAAVGAAASELKTKAETLRALSTDLPAPEAAGNGALGFAPAEMESDGLIIAPVMAAPRAAEASARKLRAMHDEAMDRLQ